MAFVFVRMRPMLLEHVCVCVCVSWLGEDKCVVPRSEIVRAHTVQGSAGLSVHPLSDLWVGQMGRRA